MVKTITFIKRKPGMSVEDFGQYWRTKHAPIVTKLPGLRRYVQCHTIPSGYRNGEPALLEGTKRNQLLQGLESSLAEVLRS